MQLVVPQIEKRAENPDIRRFPVIVDAMRVCGVVSVLRLYYVYYVLLFNNFGLF